MDIIAQNKRYLPHEITTKESAVKLYRSTKDVSFVCRRYHISKASLMRWNKLYDGTKESLLPNSHKPHTIHPNAHTPEELKWISHSPYNTVPERSIAHSIFLFLDVQDPHAIRFE